MDFDSNCYRASLISFSVIHFLSVSSLLGLIIIKGTIFDPYYNNGLLPAQYPFIVYTLALGSVLAVIASKFSRVFYSLESTALGKIGLPN